jgi:hypothetical protein
MALILKHNLVLEGIANSVCQDMKCRGEQNFDEVSFTPYIVESFLQSTL